MLSPFAAFMPETWMLQRTQQIGYRYRQIQGWQIQTDTEMTVTDGYREDRYRQIQGGQIQTDTGIANTIRYREDRYRWIQG